MDKEPPGEVNFDVLLEEKKGSSVEEEEKMDKEPPGEFNFDVLLEEKKGSSVEEQEKMDKGPPGEVNFDVLLEKKKSSSVEEQDKMDKGPPGEANFDVLLEEKEDSSVEEQEKINKEPPVKVNFDVLLQEKKSSSVGEQETNRDPRYKGRSDEPHQEKFKRSSSENRDSRIYPSTNHSRFSTYRKRDENAQARWKTFKKRSNSLYHDGKGQDGWMKNRKQRSPGYIKLNLQVKKTWHNSPGDEDKNAKLQVKNGHW